MKELPHSVTYTVTSERTGDVRRIGVLSQAEIYLDQEVVRS
jgi:hypothetical protein